MKSLTNMIGRTISHYKILEKLGEGGMGVVYKAEDTTLKRTVALKFLPADLTRDEEAKERFVHEAQAASSLDHPNICNIHEIDETDDGQIFICMAYYEGETLRKKISRKPLKLEEAIDIAIQVADGLAEAHGQDAVHRDLKSANVMITKEGVVKIIDFGLARLAGQTKLTKAGTTMGTAAYMSPEQARGEHVDHRTDIWSMGVVLYEMIAGELPFKGDYEQAVIYLIMYEDSEPITGLRTGVPTELERIVDKAMSKSPDDRYQHMDEMIVDLRSVKKEFKSGMSKEPLSKTKSLSSIAVLPFVNMSADPENEYFSDGMSEDIINALTQLKDLRVAARTSSFWFKGKSAEIAEVGAKLNVDTVLEGSVRQAGNRLRITAQLINVADGYHLWSERYDRELDDVFAIQDEIATAIAEKLKVALLGERDQSLVKPSTQNLKAYQLYLEGRFYWNRRELRRGLECFERAVDYDPDYALAYAGVADSYALLAFGYGGARPTESLPKAKQAAERALELDESLAEAHNSLAYVSLYDWEWPTAAREFKRAIELNASYVAARYYYAFYLWLVEGRTDEAIAEAQRAVEIDPLDSHAAGMLGLVLWGARRSHEAIAFLEKAIVHDPTYFFLHRCLGLAFQAEPMHTEAIAALEQAANLSGRDPLVQSELASAYALSGATQKAEDLLEELTARSRQQYVSPLLFAFIQLALGMKDEALASLERAYNEHDPMLVPTKRWPSFKPLHGDPRFESLLRRIGWK